MSDTATTTVQAPGERLDKPELQLFRGTPTLTSVTDKVSQIVEGPPPRWWWIAFAFSLSLLGLGVFAATYLISTGVGVWGLNQPVGWAFDITNFVFWVGIGHAGTLISAILLLFRQKWRTSINRFAEAMTLFAVACAGIFPLIHVGRIWMMWFLAPVPNSNAIWQNFRSPLLWDVFAVSTYALVSFMFWYVGLIPDLATIRDRSRSRVRQVVYGLLAMGWRGSADHWRHYETAVYLLAALSTPLVLSVHTVVSFDFAVSVIPGWHATVFPPYFVAGAIFSGFAMVLTLMIPCRQLYGLQDLVTERHLDMMSRVMLATSLMVGYAYGVEFFTAWYSGNVYEQFVFMNRALGPYAWSYWTMVACNVLVPQLLWRRRLRVNPWALFAISILVNVGMWFERFVIIITSLHRDFLPSSWGMFVPTWVDLIQFIGSFGLFFTLLLLFLRYLPMIAMFEVKALLAGSASDTDAVGERESTSEPTPRQETEEVVGMLARFPSADMLTDAVTDLRQQGYRKLDAFSPFPIHGLSKKLGLGRSPLPPLVFVAGALGLLLALGGILYLNVIEYPLITGGKPYGAVQPITPILFEVMILFAALATVGGLLKFTGLPFFGHPLLKTSDFRRVTSDGFFLFVDARDDQFDVSETRRILDALGGRQTQPVEA